MSARRPVTILHLSWPSVTASAEGLGVTITTLSRALREARAGRMDRLRLLERRVRPESLPPGCPPPLPVSRLPVAEHVARWRAWASAPGDDEAHAALIAQGRPIAWNANYQWRRRYGLAPRPGPAMRVLLDFAAETGRLPCGLARLPETEAEAARAIARALTPAAMRRAVL